MSDLFSVDSLTVKVNLKNKIKFLQYINKHDVSALPIKSYEVDKNNDEILMFSLSGGFLLEIIYELNPLIVY